jgi:anti-sigma factor RsiW
MSNEVSDTDLHAFIDGELTPERAAAVKAALARDLLLAARVHHFRADKLALIAAYAPLAQPKRRAGHPAITGAAAAAALAASLMLTLTPRDPVIEQALAARENARAPSRELNGQDLTGIAATDQALSAMVGNPIHVPDLGRAGFKLVSAEIYGRDRTDSIQLRYEDDAHRLFTVFLYPPGAGAFEMTERGTLRICVWRNADVTAVMTGEMSTPELLHMASLTYSSLNL